MRTKLVPIGTSKGVRIPKFLLEKYQLAGEIEMIETKEGLLLQPKRTVRQGWKEAFLKAAQQTEEESPVDMPGSEWDEDEWEW